MEHSHSLSGHFDRHTSSQNRHTILHGCRIHTSSRTSDHRCFQSAPLPPRQSADFQTNQQTGCRRNNTASHGERIQDLRNCSIHAKLPAPVKIVKHWLLCIRLFAVPILCIRFHSYIPAMQVLTFPYPVGCGKSHALLPDLIVPYLSYSLPLVLSILSDYFKRRLTIRGICEKYLVSPPLIYRFKKLFLLHKKQWLGTLRDMELPGLSFMEELLTGSYSQFHDAFLRLTTYSFLQSHKNPADCSRPRFGPAHTCPFCHNL